MKTMKQMMRAMAGWTGVAWGAGAFLLAMAMGTTAHARTWDVSIRDSFFEPENLTIQAGDTVRWTQLGSMTHTTTSGPNGVRDGKWDSGFMNPGSGAVFSRVFASEGSFPYFCTLHASFMQGTIVVKPAAASLQVSLTSPVDGATFVEPANITVTANATPGASPVTMVHFLMNATPVGEVFAAPYTLTVSNLSAGTYTFMAQAMDGIGGLVNSTPVTVTVGAAKPATLVTVEPVGALGLRLEWSGGTPPYLVQWKAALGDAEWQDLDATEDEVTIVPRDGVAGFYRVVSHADRSARVFTVVLNGASEKPVGVDTPATGYGTLVLAGTKLRLNVGFRDLSTPASASHIHGIAKTSESAGVLVPLVVPSATAGTIGGTYEIGGLTTAQRDALLQGRTYLNIHTSAHGGGEVRGQVVPVKWHANLTGAAERPNPVNTTATGYADLWVLGNEFTYDVDYLNLGSTATASHLHGPADTETAAGVLVGFKPEAPLATTGAFSGFANLNASQLAALVDGLTYVNVHSTGKPGGEIRGQVLP